MKFTPSEKQLGVYLVTISIAVDVNPIGFEICVLIERLIEVVDVHYISVPYV